MMAKTPGKTEPVYGQTDRTYHGCPFIYIKKRMNKQLRRKIPLTDAKGHAIIISRRAYWQERSEMTEKKKNKALDKKENRW